jgi:hypothetical protein
MNKTTVSLVDRRGRALSEVVASLLAVIVTLALMGFFLYYNSSYILPSSSLPPAPEVQLLSVLWTYNNYIYVENYGNTVIYVSYAIVGSSSNPSPAVVYQVVDRGGSATLVPSPNNAIPPGEVYAICVPLQNQQGNNVPVTFFTSQGNFYEVFL